MTTTLTRRALLGVCIATVVAVGAGCGNDSTDSDTTSATPSAAAPSTTVPVTPPAQLPTAGTVGVDRQSPVSVLLSACTIVFTRNTQTEPSYSSSYARAADLFTPELRTQLVQPPKGIRPLPKWVDWQRAHAWARGTCTVASDEHPADTPTTVSRVLSVTEQPYDAHGQELTSTSPAVYAIVTRGPSGWEVSQFSVADE